MRAFPVWVCLMWASQPFLDPLTVLHWGQAHDLVLPIITITGSSETFSVLTFFAGDGDGADSWVSSEISIGVGGGGVVLPFKCLRSAGKSPGAHFLHCLLKHLSSFCDHSMAHCYLSHGYN